MLRYDMLRYEKKQPPATEQWWWGGRREGVRLIEARRLWKVRSVFASAKNGLVQGPRVSCGHAISSVLPRLCRKRLAMIEAVSATRIPCSQIRVNDRLFHARELV